MVEIYTNFVGSFADSAITATRLANNNLVSFLDSARHMMGQAKRTSDDLSRASTNFAKKMEKDTKTIGESEVNYDVEADSRR
jgi:hypothetical protein